MAWDPVTDHGSKLTYLQIEPAVLPRGHAKCIFVQSNLSAVIARVEPAIEPGLRKKVNLTSKLGIEKKCQPRIEKTVYLAVDRGAGCWHC